MDIVIGLNYGDEGKGATVDYLSRKRKYGKTVVRFNGGAQAGHTVVGGDIVGGEVVNEERVRHVFHQFGSGTFNDASTTLSRFHIFNPTLFRKEREEIIKISIYHPEVYLEPRALVTTPFDVMINQVLEESRGNVKGEGIHGKGPHGKGEHGSCGVGINETVERSDKGYPLIVNDYNPKSKNKYAIKNKLDKIYSEYLPKRLKQLGIQKFDSDIKTLVMDRAEEVCNKFLEDMEYSFEYITLKRDKDAVSHHSNIIFEGAQGLLLDQNSDDFPHVTRSNTGLENVESLVEDWGKSQEEINIYYVTRCYLTRHGKGPLKDEIHEDLSIVDETNITNKYQHHLRFAPLDFYRMAEVVGEQQRKYFSNVPTKTTAVITCCDHFDKVKPYYGGMDLEAVISSVKHSVMADKLIISHAPRIPN